MVSAPPRDSQIIGELLATERVLFVSDVVCIGQLRCAPDHPLFPGGNPSNGHCIAFPRSSIWVQHERGPRFVEDPSVVGLYNRGQAYRRWPIRADGDCADWLAFPTHLIHDVLGTLGRKPARDSDESPFEVSAAPLSSAAYITQRRLFDALSGGRAADALHIDELALHLLDVVLRAASASSVREPLAHRRRAALAVEHVRETLARRLSHRVHLSTLAAEVGSSPFHLCRTFREITGMTLTQYRNQLRLRVALEPVAAGVDITRLALDLGFCSHSHFTASFRRAFGLTPSVFRGLAGDGLKQLLPRSA